MQNISNFEACASGSGMIIINLIRGLNFRIYISGSPKLAFVDVKSCFIFGIYVRSRTVGRS